MLKIKLSMVMVIWSFSSTKKVVLLKVFMRVFAIVVQKDLVVDVSLDSRKLDVSTQKGLVVDVSLTQGRLSTGVIASVSTPMSIVNSNILVGIFTIILRLFDRS